MLILYVPLIPTCEALLNFFWIRPWSMYCIFGFCCAGGCLLSRLKLLAWLLHRKDSLCCVVCSFSRLFTSSDKPSTKPSSSPALSYKSSTKRGTVRPVADPNRPSREGQTSRAFDFLQDDLYVYTVVSVCMAWCLVNASVWFLFGVVQHFCSDFEIATHCD